MTPERINELRGLLTDIPGLRGDAYWTALFQLKDAMPALLDAAEENVRLRADISKLDYVLDVLGIAETDRNPADCVKEWIVRVEQAHGTVNRRDADLGIDARTRELPVGHEIKERGQSTYNWHMSCLREIRALADELEREMGDG